MDNQRPRDMNPPSQQKTAEEEANCTKDETRKIFPYSVQLLAKAKKAGK